MHPISALAATYNPEKGTIVISALYDRTFKIVGCSFPHDGGIGEGVNSFCFAVKPEETGVIAAVIDFEQGHGKYSRSSSQTFFLPVDWKEENRPLNLSEPWVPPSDRLARIEYVSRNHQDEWVQKYAIIVEIKNEIFTTIAYDPSKRCVDADLLCRYLAEKTTAEEVIAAAEEAETLEDWQQTLLQNVRTLQEENAALRQKAEILEQQLAKSEKSILSSKENLDNALECARFFRSTRWDWVWKIIGVIFANKYYSDILRIHDELVQRIKKEKRGLR